jgi:hypothetical protein
LLLAVRLYLLRAKVQTGSIVLGGEDDVRWRYFSKFGMGLGEGTYDLRVRLQEPWSIATDSQIAFQVYLDEDWPSVETVSPCDRGKRDMARNTWHPTVKKTGAWSQWQRGSLLQRVRPHIWYFALSDCRPSPGRNSTLNLEFEFHARQENGSEFSFEAQHMLLAQTLMLCLFTVFLAWFARRCQTSWRSTGGVMHPVVWCLTAAVGLQYAAQALHVGHLWRFAFDGVGAWTIDALSENLFMASQVLHTTLILIIAQGHTLLTSSSGHGCDLALMKRIAAGVLVLHAALVGLGKLQDGASHKHHENDGLIGWAILAIRLALYVWFLKGVRALRQRGGFRLDAFLQQFRFAGSLYFLAYPVIFVIAQVFAPYLRHPIMQGGLLVTKLLSNAWLASLFLSRGSYFRVSALSASLLPGGGSPRGFEGGGFGALGKQE